MENIFICIVSLYVYKFIFECCIYNINVMSTEWNAMTFHGTHCQAFTFIGNIANIDNGEDMPGQQF